jgi:hypothetical protein
MVNKHWSALASRSLKLCSPSGDTLAKLLLFVKTRAVLAVNQLAARNNLCYHVRPVVVRMFSTVENSDEMEPFEKITCNALPM